MEFRFDYLKCHNCENQDLCASCEACLTEKLLLEQEIRCVNLQISEKILSISSGLELPELEALLRKHDVLVH